MSEQDRRRIVALQEDNIKLIDEAERTRAEAARYRAALEEVLEQIGTSGGFPPDLTIKAIENIADRALHPEGTD